MPRQIKPVLSNGPWLTLFTQFPVDGVGDRKSNKMIMKIELISIDRTARHPLLDAATATGGLTISWAREIAGWTGRIDHQELQAEADQILVEAAAAGADLDDLRILAQAAYEAWRAQEPDPDEDPAGRRFGDRYAQLDTTIDRAARITGDLTPECAAAVTAVLEALGKRRGREDLHHRAAVPRRPPAGLRATGGYVARDVGDHIVPRPAVSWSRPACLGYTYGQTKSDSVYS
jgi:hypothetical protein